MGNQKNLYLIYQNCNQSYDTYDSAVVVAESEEEARRIHPNNLPLSGYCDFSTWAKPDRVHVRLIGTAVGDMEGDVVVCASFNAG